MFDVWHRYSINTPLRKRLCSAVLAKLSYLSMLLALASKCL